jgi:tetratricopeptide (TPR) repeat protein
MCFIWLSMLGNASACLWLRGTTIDGKYVETGEDSILGLTSEGLQWRSALSPEDRKAFIIQHFPESTDPIDQESDAAVEVLMDGDAQKAVTMLEALEKKHPDRYYTAANLGTAYELSGNDQKALKWILEGIRRNPDSHMETEWLHARILETKIKLKSDPTWLESHTITEADFLRLRDPAYQLQTRQRPVDAKDLHRSLWHQLDARMLFVKPKDAIVAQLLKELALIEAQIGLLEEATRYREMAIEYGMPRSELQAEKEQWARIIKRAKFTKNLPGIQYTLVVPILIGYLLLKALQIRKRKEAMKVA